MKDCLASNVLHHAPFVLFDHNIVHEFALLTRIDRIYILLPTAVASFDGHNDTASSFVDHDDMASFVDHDDTASFVDHDDTASFVDHDDTASFDGHNDMALMAYMALAVSIVADNYNSLVVVEAYNYNA